MARGGSDEVLVALDTVINALEQNSRIIATAVKRSRAMTRERAKGHSYRDIVSAEGRPLVVEMLSDNIGRLLEAGATLRRAEAKALHDEGATMEEIATLFGVTRQRVSTLLRDGRRIAERDVSRRPAARKGAGRPRQSGSASATGRTAAGKRASSPAKSAGRATRPAAAKKRAATGRTSAAKATKSAKRPGRR